MTTTAPPRSLVGDRARLPAPVRDRRPALAALALLLVMGGALTSALIAYRSGDRVEVLVARGDIEVGQTLTEADLETARVANDGGIVIPVEDRDNFVGRSVATTRIPAGTLLNKEMFLSDASAVPAGAQVVGVVLSATQRPAEELQPDDVVRVFLVPRETGDGAQGTILASAVRVAEAPGGGSGDTVRLSLLVPDYAATAVVTAAATGSLAVTRLAPGFRPLVDFRRS